MKLRIRVLTGCFFYGVTLRPGQVLDVAEGVARELVDLNRAEFVDLSLRPTVEPGKT